MRFHERVGILPHERKLAQPMEIDLDSWVRSTGSPSDVLDYRILYDLVADVVARGPNEFLEVVATAVSDAVLRLDGVERVRVTVRKPHVALPGPLAYAGVTIDRSHDG
jgi:dihydroneopterin aldolase